MQGLYGTGKKQSKSNKIQLARTRCLMENQKTAKNRRKGEECHESNEDDVQSTLRISNSERYLVTSHHGLCGKASSIQKTEENRLVL